MNTNERLRLLIVCPQCNGEDVGESWCGYQWVSHLSKVCDTTVLTQRFPGQTPPSQQITGARVVEWNAFPFLSALPRLNRTLKPWYVHFYVRARRWMRKELERGASFDLIHQITPMAMRFPSPCSGLGPPYILGPVAGSLPSPEEFASELVSEPAFYRLRDLDRLRMRHDPMLRRTYENAALVICSSPYVESQLKELKVARVAIESEVGISGSLHHRQTHRRDPDRFRMLFVGRIVRTKGLRDAIRALAKLDELPGITLTVAGDGEDLAACKKEALSVGVAEKVNFLGRQSRQQVESLYRNSDLFLFPSFREPTGIVLFEAMQHGLPVITADRGGPGHIVTDECGIKVPVQNPPQFADDLSKAIRKLAEDETTVEKLSLGAVSRVKEIGLWEGKINRVLRLYDEILNSQ